MNQPDLPAVDPKPRRVMRQPRKAWYRQRLADALNELDAAHAENIRLREAMRRPWWLRIFWRVK